MFDDNDWHPFNSKYPLDKIWIHIQEVIEEEGEYVSARTPRKSSHWLEAKDTLQLLDMWDLFVTILML